MNTALALVADVELAFAASQAESYARAAVPENTATAFRAGWTAFEGWCRVTGRPAMPASPETVALFLGSQGATLKLSTLRLRAWAIGKAHRIQGATDPTKSEAVRAIFKGKARTEGAKPARKAAATVDVLRSMIDVLPSGVLGARDRALLLVGFAGALRRSELVALRFEDARFAAAGLVLTIKRSKTDQGGNGAEIGVAYGSHPETCPVRNLLAWIEAAGITAGPLFRSVSRHGTAGEGLTDRSVALVVKRSAESAGLDSSTFSGHSLRAGFATTAAEKGVSENAIMRQTRHRSRAMMDLYIRPATLFRANASASVGL